MEETFTLDQIKNAFWENFHESGEFWFDYLGSSEDNTEATDKYWEDFEEKLLGQIS